MLAKLALLILTGTATSASLVAVRQARLQAVAEMTAALKEAHQDDLATRRVRTEIQQLTTLDRAWELQASMPGSVAIELPRWDTPQHVYVLPRGWPVPEPARPSLAGFE
jgi:hypothetical protein